MGGITEEEAQKGYLTLILPVIWGKNKGYLPKKNCLSLIMLLIRQEGPDLHHSSGTAPGSGQPLGNAFLAAGGRNAMYNAIGLKTAGLAPKKAVIRCI